jgi:hypothetical protein
MTKNEMFDRALKLAVDVNFYKTDSLGKPCVLFLLQATQCFLYDLELGAIWLLHNVLERSTYTLYDASSVGFSPRVLSGLECLRHRHKESYEDFIDRICTNEDAIKVQIKLLLYDTSVVEQETFEMKDLDKLSRYRNAYKKLVILSNGETLQVIP